MRDLLAEIERDRDLQRIKDRLSRAEESLAQMRALSTLSNNPGHAESCKVCTHARLVLNGGGS